VEVPPREHPGLSQALPGGGNREAALAVDGGALDGGEPRWTARVPARSQVRPGEPIGFAVDPAGLYFFNRIPARP